MPRHHHQVALLSHLDQRLGFLGGTGERLLDKDMLPRLEGALGQGEMGWRGGVAMKTASTFSLSSRSWKSVVIPSRGNRFATRSRRARSRSQAMTDLHRRFLDQIPDEIGTPVTRTDDTYRRHERIPFRGKRPSDRPLPLKTTGTVLNNRAISRLKDQVWRCNADRAAPFPRREPGCDRLLARAR